MSLIKLATITNTISNLLDNITAANREFIDRKLIELKRRQQEIECRLEELERLIVSQGQIREVVSEARQFLGGLKGTLDDGLPQENLVALRQCVAQISIDKPGEAITLHMRLVPTGGQAATEEKRVPIALKRADGRPT